MVPRFPTLTASMVISGYQYIRISVLQAGRGAEGMWDVVGVRR
jgi:hypothetical protein